MAFHSQRMGIFVISVLICLMVSGCALRQHDSSANLPVLKNIQIITVPMEDTLALTPAMKEFVAKHANRRQRPKQRLKLLIDAVTHPGLLGFQYEEDQTLTAPEAFTRRSGNCIAFTNLFIALARQAGLKAYYQEVRVNPYWAEKSDTYLLAKHINVLVRLKSGDYVIDIGRKWDRGHHEVNLVSDDYAKAQYYNNLGVDALLSNRMASAYGYFERAIRIEPTLDYIWSNLGVLYNRNGQPEQAIWAYQQALKVNRRALMAISNLAGVYAQQGDANKARQLEQKVENYRRDNPYYLLMLSNKALAEMDYQGAIQLLRQAIHKKENDHRLHLALAKSLYLSGQVEQAQESYERAKQLAPGPILKGVYDKALDELISSKI